MDEGELKKSICVVGAGAAGLITAHTLLKDGFTRVDVVSRDKSAGGVWAEERVYPGLALNNVHGEFSFSPLPMPPPSQGSRTGGRLSGEDLVAYMESFAERFLKGRIRYQTEVLNIRRRTFAGVQLGQQSGDEQHAGSNYVSEWVVRVRDLRTGDLEELVYDRVVVCSGGCSKPKIPSSLSQEAAKKHGFRGVVCHSVQFRDRMDDILKAVRPLTDSDPGAALIIGGGKSAQDIAAYLANQGRRVSMVFETTDAFLGVTSPLPDFIRKSKFLTLLSPYYETRTWLERFLHKTWLGAKIVQGIWRTLQSSSFDAFKVPKDSPLRNAGSVFWTVRLNDEGVGGPDRFHSLTLKGKISLTSPARAVGFSDAPGGRGVLLNDGRTVEADAVILATGWESSWDDILDKDMMEELGLDRHAPYDLKAADLNQFNYASLQNPPSSHKTANSEWAASIYRGIVPARNILRRDFAVNGAMITTNNGYTFEVAAHWIASYFRKDPIMTRLPRRAEEAIYEAERHNAWLRKRFPGMFNWLSQSYAGDLVFFNWPHAVDTLLEDMSLRTMRSGGNWLTWPFKVVSLQEIAHLTEERAEQRAALSK